MDFLLELLFELFGAILESIIESDRVPKWARCTLLGIILLGMVALLCLGIYHATEVVLAIILGILALGLLALFIFFVYSIHRSGILRQAKQEELREILSMYRSVIGKPGCSWSISYPNEATLHEDFRAGNLFVLCRGKTVIGAGSIVPRNELDDLNCWYYREEAREIARIVIKPEYQSKGYGKHLINKLCLKLEYKHCQVVHILVSKENHHALNLYRETGFRCKGECERYGHSYYAYEKKL